MNTSEAEQLRRSGNGARARHRCALRKATPHDTRQLRTATA